MSNRWKIVLLAVAIIAVSVFGFSLLDVSSGENIGTTTILNLPDVDTSGFTQAIEPYDWQFPQDFGAHPDFQTEWWYYTGNLSTAEGRRFGFQFTIFRRAITPDDISTDSEWRSNQIYLVHFTVSDIAGNQFFNAQRLSRGGAGLAGASSDPRYRVWVEDWEILAQNDAASLITIQAAADDFAIDLTLEQVKPPALQGDGGLSQKSSEEGNASYYYSLSRLLTTGTITINDEVFTVSGNTWKDHEFSTSALGDGAQGWDWFGLIFDDDTELMLGQIRMVDDSIEAAFGGLIVYPDGSTEHVSTNNFSITPTNIWTSPHTDANYPSGWDISVETSTGTLNFHVEPLLADQELADSDPSYWEGAVVITGDVTGYGYAELTGYTTSMQNRF
ncbi:MAG: lipocalin-like domain-containing protein [Anaerolineae bacterium]|nr:lipocalin-like domain-containing protein [Anaerolineae bacterium]MDQ7034696.1 lipocalin-like domain-containing protein [Anaerolineae bacterium]